MEELGDQCKIVFARQLLESAVEYIGGGGDAAPPHTYQTAFAGGPPQKITQRRLCIGLLVPPWFTPHKPFGVQEPALLQPNIEPGQAEKHHHDLRLGKPGRGIHAGGRLVNHLFIIVSVKICKMIACLQFSLVGIMFGIVKSRKQRSRVG